MRSWQAVVLPLNSCPTYGVLLLEPRPFTPALCVQEAALKLLQSVNFACWSHTFTMPAPLYPAGDGVAAEDLH